MMNAYTPSAASQSTSRETRVRSARSANHPSTMYTTSSSTFTVSQACTNGYWCTTVISISAAVSNTVSTA